MHGTREWGRAGIKERLEPALVCAHSHRVASLGTTWNDDAMQLVACPLSVIIATLLITSPSFARARRNACSAARPRLVCSIA